MPPTAFASREPLPDDAPFRAPRPSRLREPLVAAHKKAADALEALGLHTVGDLLVHLPRDRREGATVAELQIDQTATGVVEVRSIRRRQVRRRGIRPLVEATVADATGVLKATFFNQPWLAQRYPPGTRLALDGKYQGGNRFRVSEHRVTEAVAGSETVAVYAASEGITSSELHGLVDAHRGALADVAAPLPAR